MMRSRLSRARVIAETRAWIGTPYHHQASVRGVGADCLGLVRGVWRGLYGNDAERPPAYSPDWAEASGRETLIEAAHRHLLSVAVDAHRPGDVLVFRLRDGLPAKHTGIQVSATTMVHASEGRAAAEVVLVPWWRRRLAGVFQFPGLTNARDN